MEVPLLMEEQAVCPGLAGATVQVQYSIAQVSSLCAPLILQIPQRYLIKLPGRYWVVTWWSLAAVVSFYCCPQGDVAQPTVPVATASLGVANLVMSASTIPAMQAESRVAIPPVMRAENSRDISSS